VRSIFKTVKTEYKPEWVRQEFMTYGPDFREARKDMRRKFDRCFSCSRSFKDGETMALGSFGKHGNKTLCQECAVHVAGGWPGD